MCCVPSAGVNKTSKKSRQVNVVRLTNESSDSSVGHAINPN